MEKELRFRQIHLDFHTSELIGGIGGQFNAKEFAGRLKKASVNSITCFARCHHGMMYYDSTKFPERVHPGLINKNLLKEQIDACHKEGINVPVYITVQWDYYSAAKNPEWLMRSEDGAPIGQSFMTPGFYQFLCVNTSYGQFLKEHTREVLDNLDADGLFFDIVQSKPCACGSCISSMEQKGYNPLSEKDRLDHYAEVLKKFKSEMTALINSIKPDISVFYNSGHIAFETKETMTSYTHFELESLPSGEWGYTHFPITMKYARNLGKDCLAMTGKFHTSWGDFHSFKNKEALEYECLRMLALNAKCMIGDQLEPSGVLSADVYDLIGGIYDKVKEREAWCEGAEHVAEIGVFAGDEFTMSGLDCLPEAQVGVTRLMEQCSYQFDFIDSTMDFTKYRLLVMPDTIPVNEKLASKISSYILSGGKILASFESGMDEKSKKFKLAELGVFVKNITVDDYGTPVKGRMNHNNDFADYVIPEGQMGKGLNHTEYVMYAKGVETEAVENGVSEIKGIEPYFNRSYRHFSSHRQAPSSGKPAYDAVVSTNSTVYFSHPVFAIYNKLSPKWIKTMVSNAITMLLGKTMIEHNGPSCVMTAINKQEHKRRYALHILSYIPQRKSADIDIIEDIIPLYNLEVTIRLPEPIKTLKAVVGGNVVDVAYNKDGCSFRIEKLEGGILIEAGY